MRASRAISKCLIWFAVLLSPLQALQGTPILCYFVGSSHGSAVSARNDRPDQGSSCRRCDGKTNRLEQTGEARNGYAADWPESAGHVDPRRNCPPDCLCRRPANPQSQPISPIQLKVVDRLVASAVAQVDARCNASLHGCTDPRRKISSPASAQQICATLCRFTT